MRIYLNLYKKLVKSLWANYISKKLVNSLDKYCDASELCINKFLNWNLKQIDIEIFFEWFFSSNHKDQY